MKKHGDMTCKRGFGIGNLKSNQQTLFTEHMKPRAQINRPSSINFQLSTAFYTKKRAKLRQFVSQPILPEIIYRWMWFDKTCSETVMTLKWGHDIEMGGSGSRFTVVTDVLMKSEFSEWGGGRNIIRGITTQVIWCAIGLTALPQTQIFTLIVIWVIVERN